MTIDFYHDPGHATLRQLFNRAPLAQEMLKNAELEEDGSDLPNSAFAWEAKRLFPVHTPEHAAVSYLYAKHASQQVPTAVLHFIKEALDLYQISERDLSVVQEKEAALEEDECIFPEAKAFPVRTSGEVKIAEQHLLQQVSKLHPETRATAFTRLVKAAELHGVKLNGASLKYAGMTYTDRPKLVDSLNARAAATKNTELRNKFAALAESVKKDRTGLRNQAIRAKLASTIGTLDEEAGFLGLYDRSIPDPISTVFNTEKVASHDDVDLGGGRMVSASALAKLPPSFFGDHFGDDIISEIAPDGHVDPQLVKQVVDTFPADMKQSFAKNLAKSGISVTST